MKKELIIGSLILLFILAINTMQVGAQSSCKTCHPEEYSEFNQSLKKYSFMTCKHCHVAHDDTKDIRYYNHGYYLVRSEEEICTRCHTSVPGAHNTISPIHDRLSGEGCNATCVQCHMPMIEKHIENNYSITNHSMKFYLESCITGDCHLDKDIEWSKEKLAEMNSSIGTFHESLEKGSHEAMFKGNIYYSVLGMKINGLIDRSKLKKIAATAPWVTMAGLSLVFYGFLKRFYLK